jgi:hypothetical protein
MADIGNEITINKVKYNKEGVFIEYFEITKSGYMKSHTTKSAEPPDKSFIDALRALAPDVIGICELPGNYEERIKVTGLTITASGSKSATITAQMALRNANVPLNLNTPHTKIEHDALRLKVHNVEREAIAYICGHRAQGSLFPPELEEEVAKVKMVFGDFKAANAAGAH